MELVRDTEPSADTMFTFRRVGKAGVVSLTCAALRERQATLLSGYLGELAERMAGQLVLDVEGVRDFSCAWINTLIELSGRCVSEGGQLIVVGLSASAQKMLRQTGLDKRLRVERCPAVALRSLGVPVVDSWRLVIARWLHIPVDRMALVFKAA